MSKLSELVEQIKAHASEHYTEGGWDVIVETWDDENIAEYIKGARTLTGALKKMSDVIDVYSDRQHDAHVTSGGETPKPTKRTATKSTTNKPAAAAKPAASKRAKATQPAADKPAAPKGGKAAPKAAKVTTKTNGRALATLSSDQSDVPADPDQLRKLIKVTRDRRWRAGRRGDETLVEQMNAQLDIFTAALDAN